MNETALRLPAGDICYALADITKAKQCLNWQPQISVAEGLDKFSKWAKGERG
jgi:nucleoside-diphosphate-sugar epimerase